MANPITISLCMIVKNEEDVIARCLENVYRAVDEIVIVDTGSTDATKAAVKPYTDRVLDFKWADHFAAARNFAFNKATKDNIFWLDADDRLLPEDQKKLLQLRRNLSPDIDAVTMLYHLGADEAGNPVLSCRRHRLVKRSNHFQWHGAVHEYLAVSGHVMHSDITVKHHGSRRRAAARNLFIYEKQLAKGVTFTPRDNFYYANELFDHGRYEDAIPLYLKTLAAEEGWVEDKIAACGKLADIYYYLQDHVKERHYAVQSFVYDTPRAEFCCRIGFQFLRNKDHQRAAFWYNLAAELQKPANHLGFTYEACWTWLPHIQLSVCYYHLGDDEKAHYHNEMARKYNPTHQLILHNKRLFEEIQNRKTPQR